jgi:hypothetical protein
MQNFQRFFFVRFLLLRLAGFNLKEAKVVISQIVGAANRFVFFGTIFGAT